MGLNPMVISNPAPENTEHKIQQVDLEGQPVAEVIAENIVDAQRGTVLAHGDVYVPAVEHGLSALYAIGIDDYMIQVDGPELPILDGSTNIYVNKIQETGIVEQSTQKDFYIVRKRIEVKNKETGSCITILPDDQLSITTMYSFGSESINSQFATLDSIDDYATKIAPARTLVFVRGILPLLEVSLIKGGDMDNAIVIYEREVLQEQLGQLADVLKVSRMGATKTGYIQHKPLMWENECTRYKLLDVIGDMALIGKPIKGRTVAIRLGHTINNKFTRLMRREIRKHEIQAPIYDPNEPPIVGNERVKELFPHRYPMQLVDKVIVIGFNTTVGIKNITSNESPFAGHFPQEPVIFGVLQVGAMAQCGGLLVLNQAERPERQSIYFPKIDSVKPRQKAVPNDTITFRVEMIQSVRHGISTMKGYAFAGDQVVSKAMFTAQIIKNR